MEVKADVISVARFDQRMNQIMQRGIDSLNIAASRGHMDAVRHLSSGASLKTLNEALGWAAFAGQLKSVQMLVHQGANVDALDAHGRTPVHWAAYMGHQPVFQWLLGQGADVLRPEARPPRYTPIDILVWKGRGELLSWLVGGAHGATDELQAPILQVLLSRPQMCRAAAGGHLDVVKWLLGLGVQVDAPDEDAKTPLWHAAEQRHADVCSWLVGQGASAVLLSSAALTELLCVAAQSGDTALLRAAVAAGAPIAAAGVCGITPMQWAVRSGKSECVQLLSAAGADVLAPMLAGSEVAPRNALHAAVIQEDS